MTPRGWLTGCRTRIGNEPPAARTRASCTRAISGPGPAWPRRAATAPRASAGVSSCSGPVPVLASWASRVTVASSSAMRCAPRGESGRPAGARGRLGDGGGRPAGGQGEARVAAGCYLGALEPVVADAADVGQEQAGLARDIGAHVPGGGLREE